MRERERGSQEETRSGKAVVMGVGVGVGEQAINEQLLDMRRAQTNT